MGASLPDNKYNPGVENRILDELYNRKSFDDPEERVRIGSQEEP